MMRRMPERAEKVLSYAQQRLWFLDQFEPDSDNDNVLLALRLRGEFSQWALQTALDALVARHEPLRTSFGSEQGRPVVQVHDALELPFQVVDLCHLDEPEREATAREHATALAREPFNLSQAPLLRGLLLRLGEREHVLVLSFHHIVVDGWSAGVLTRELGEVYAAAVRGEPVQLPE